MFVFLAQSREAALDFLLQKSQCFETSDMPPSLSPGADDVVNISPKTNNEETETAWVDNLQKAIKKATMQRVL